MFILKQLGAEDREGSQRCQHRKEMGNLNFPKRRIWKTFVPLEKVVIVSIQKWLQSLGQSAPVFTSDTSRRPVGTEVQSPARSLALCPLSMSLCPSPAVRILLSLDELPTWLPCLMNAKVSECWITPGFFFSHWTCSFRAFVAHSV